jgi:hypothetical protein
MAFYIGKPHWLYQQLTRKWIYIHKNTSKLMPFGLFKEKIEAGSEFWFAGDSYKTGEKSNVTWKDANTLITNPS